MKIIRIFLIIVLVGVLVAAATQEKKPPPAKIIKKEVTVEGNKTWVNTGLAVKSRDRVTITATGQVCFSSGDPDSGVNPDGYQDEHGIYKEGWPGDYTQCDDPLPNENHASLLADIGQMFFVGKQKAFTGKEGFLYLGINDCSLTGDFYNTGAFKVLIKIERK